MAELTLDELKTFLRRSVGEDESIDLSGDILDTDLAELGFDSLAIIDTKSRIEQHLGIRLPETETTTARELIEVANAQAART